MLCPQCGKDVGDVTKFCDSCSEAAEAVAASERSSRGTSSASMHGDTLVEEFHSGDYAGFWIRFAAYLIDGTIIGIPSLALKVIFLERFSELLLDRFGNMFSSGPSNDLLTGIMLGSIFRFLAGMVAVMLSFAVVAWLYYAIFESSPRRATPGKILCGLAVTTVEGERISFMQATIRHLMKLISWIIFGLGYFIMLVTERRQTLHDLASRCVVVRTYYPPVIRTWGLAIGSFVLMTAAQAMLSKTNTLTEERMKRIAINLEHLEKQPKWRTQINTAPSSVPLNTARVESLPKAEERPEAPVQEVKDIWAGFPEQSGTRANIGVNGRVTTAKTVLALAYPAGNSIAIGFFPERLEHIEVQTFVKRGSLTSSVNNKHALLILNIQLRTLSAAITESDVLGYTATVYRDSTGGVLNGMHRAVSVSRSKENFAAGEKVRLTGNSSDRGTIEFAFSVDDVATPQGQNRFRWDCDGSAIVARMPG